MLQGTGLHEEQDLKASEPPRQPSPVSRLTDPLTVQTSRNRAKGTGQPAPNVVPEPSLRELCGLSQAPPLTPHRALVAGTFLPHLVLSGTFPTIFSLWLSSLPGMTWFAGLAHLFVPCGLSAPRAGSSSSFKATYPAPGAGPAHDRCSISVYLFVW